MPRLSRVTRTGRHQCPRCHYTAARSHGPLGLGGRFPNVGTTSIGNMVIACPCCRFAGLARTFRREYDSNARILKHNRPSRRLAGDLE